VVEFRVVGALVGMAVGKRVGDAVVGASDG